MQKIEFIDWIHNVLAPIDKTNRFHKENIRIACDLVYSQFMSRVSDDILGDLDIFSQEYPSQVATLDPTRNLYYVDLPAEIISIPGITSGVRHVSTDQNMALDFVPTTEREVYYMDGSVTQLVDTTIGYWLQGTKIWFDETMTAAIAAAGVRIILLPRFSGFDNSDVITIPGGSDLDFIQTVVQLLAPTAPVDLKANNA